VFIAVGVLICYLMGKDLEWNWLALVSCIFLVPFTFGLYFIPESPPWLVYNDEEDLAFKSMVLIRGEEYDATVEIRRIKDNLARHRNDLHALLHESEQVNAALNSSSGAGAHSHSLEPQQLARFGCKDLGQPSVFYPFMVILVLMFLLQFSGQGAVTFYAALIFEEAETALDPKHCAVVVGTAYLLSSILGLFLKKQVYFVYFTK
jgi:facilitated trehalose transporter